METTHIALFKRKEIRKTLHGGEWWFVINDIIEALTDSRDPAQYFKRLKERDASLAELTDKRAVQFVPPLMLEVSTSGGKQKAYCWHTEGIFRLVQSIPSPKAEPLKRWLAKVGFERVQEIENPELATKRTRILYKLKKDAKRGGKIAGIARNELEKEIGRPVVSRQNHLPRKKTGKSLL